MVTGKEASPQDVKDTERLKTYWTKGEGLAKWAETDHPWTELYHHLAKYMEPEEAKRTATVWYHDVFGYYPNSAEARAAHGKSPRGGGGGKGKGKK
jgi:hypothetical protein